MKILITNAENRKSFDVINITLRYYQRKNLLITSGKESNLLSIIYFGLTKLRTENYDVFGNDLKEILKGISEKEKIVYLPIEEITTLHFYNFIEKNKELKNRFLFLLPPIQSFTISRDKYLLNLFCIEHDIATSPIITPVDIKSKNTEFKPLIYKPRIGTGSKGIHIIKSREDLEGIQYDNDHFLQYFIGNGITVDGGFYLMQNGELQSFYSHRRIRTYPPEGGVSVFSKTTQNDRIKDMGRALLQKLNWSGLAMIEFIYDHETDNYMVIEINPRLWGSIMLSEINQSCFIKQYIRLSMGMEIEKTPINYDTYIRWIIPWDLMLYIKKLGNIKQFWKLNIKKTGYIGFTYSNIIKSLLFILYSILNIKNIKRIIH